jgi:pimeloyl-ACP methyl ester carboxylesterase
MKRIASLVLFALIGYVAYGNGNPAGTDTNEIVRISNTNQVIRIKGNNNQNPILLYLNGGPGDTVLDQMDKLFGEFQKDFIVVLWDQRNSGKTARLNSEKVPLTQELLKNDTYQLIRYLLQKFNRTKILLVAHSYGTTLGFDIAKNHPELLYAFVATNLMTKQVESEQITLEMLKAHARETNNTKAIHELAGVTIPFKTGEELYYARKWLFDFEGKSFAKKELFKKSVLSWSLIWLELFNEASRENLFESAKKIDCPVLMIIGNRDYQTNFKLTQAYFNRLEAPEKEVYSIENAGHLIPFENSMEFQHAVTKYALPIIQGNAGNSTVVPVMIFQ